MKNWKFTFWLLFLFAFNASYAQLSILSPVNNQVMQRDAAGFANIPITAYSYLPYSNIKAVLTPIEGNLHSGREMNATPDQIAQGFLSFTFQAESGWYQLKLIGTTEEGFTDSTVIARVGVGEVFMVAGNSNAMGLPGLGAKDASSNVISFNKTNKILNRENITVAPNQPLPAPTFEVLRKENFVFPNGETSWYWGELGDRLSARWNCPVLFFNTAWAAANSENYRDAATGKDAYNLYVGKFWPNRQPYSNIVNTLKYLTASTGVRAVLFSHGENDAQLGFNETNYFNHIRTLIANSRIDAGYNASWVLARNSVSNLLPNPYLPVLNAQNRLTEIAGFNAFKGPYLDTIQIPRPVSGHFESLPGGVAGLTLAAEAWNRSLADSLVEKLAPILPKYSIHTGVVPALAFPGAAFTIPYFMDGNAVPNQNIQAELLDNAGNFVDTLATNNANPIQISLPRELGNGYYRIRLTGTSPTLPGSVSDSFYVDKSYSQVDFVNKLSVRPAGTAIYVSWLLAVDPQLRQVILQKTRDGITYSDLQTSDVSPNQSQVFGYRDIDPNSEANFYRLKLSYQNGSEAFSRVITYFRNGGPPDFTIFPNPVNGSEFYLKATGNKADYALFDMAGREHPIRFSDREVIGLITIKPIHTLPAGSYILKVTSESGVVSRRVLVK
ncbi:T9SS type A sorting domain-containing protein [Dyadobacter linearis]|nr:T9SS type A sorting domain-containing protein [Dyadobacter sp. CECT 9623]